MEMGADAVLVNTAIAIAKDPEKIAEAFKLAVIAGRTSYLFRGHSLSGISRLKANASSPLTGFLYDDK
jgi:thiazole synthase